jgi:hypothetical protein
MKVNAALDGCSCSRAGCKHHYTVADGHFRLVNGEKKTKNVKGGTECTTHLYIAKRSQTNADTEWLCPNKDCPSKRH